MPVSYPSLVSTVIRSATGLNSSARPYRSQNQRLVLQIIRKELNSQPQSLTDFRTPRMVIYAQTSLHQCPRRLLFTKELLQLQPYPSLPPSPKLAPSLVFIWKIPSVSVFCLNQKVRSDLLSSPSFHPL